MKCLRSLENWDRGFESHPRHRCLCVRLFGICVVLCVGSGLATGRYPSKESYRLYEKEYEIEEEARAQQWTVEPLMMMMMMMMMCASAIRKDVEVILRVVLAKLT
jgi:hypothetical protein